MQLSQVVQHGYGQQELVGLEHQRTCPWSLPLSRIPNSAEGVALEKESRHGTALKAVGIQVHENVHLSPWGYGASHKQNQPKWRSQHCAWSSSCRTSLMPTKLSCGTKPHVEQPASSTIPCPVAALAHLLSCKVLHTEISCWRKCALPRLIIVGWCMTCPSTSRH